MKTIIININLGSSLLYCTVCMCTPAYSSAYTHHHHQKKAIVLRHGFCSYCSYTYTHTYIFERPCDKSNLSESLVFFFFFFFVLLLFYHSKLLFQVACSLRMRCNAIFMMLFRLCYGRYITASNANVGWIFCYLIAFYLHQIFMFVHFIFSVHKIRLFYF